MFYVLSLFSVVFFYQSTIITFLQTKTNKKLSRLFKSFALILWYWWQCKKKCAVDSTSKLQVHNGLIQF